MRSMILSLMMRDDDDEDEDNRRDWNVVFKHIRTVEYTARIKRMGDESQVTVENFRERIRDAEFVRCDAETTERFSFSESLCINQELWDLLNESYENESNGHQEDLMARINENI